MLLFSNTFPLSILVYTALTTVVVGSNFKCPKSSTVYYPCKCFTWDEQASTKQVSISSSGPSSLPESAPSPFAVLSTTTDTPTQEVTSSDDISSREPTTTVLPSSTGNLNLASSARDTEVEISCRTLETDEESLRHLFARLNTHIEENAYTKRFMSLRLENTAIASIPEDIFQGISFQALDFFQNIDLEAVNLQAFTNSYATLETLLIQGSAIEGSEAFYRNITKFSGLETLILSNNKLKGLPDEAFGQIPLVNLSYVDLSGNKLTTIGPRSFFRLPNLQRLSLDNNMIDGIKKGSFDFESADSKLLLIFLRHNNLTADSIEAGSFDYLNQTVFLYLNNNQLTHLEESVFKPLLTTKNDIFIALWSNPFVCDCRSRWLFENRIYYRKRLHGFKCLNHNKLEIWDLSDDDLAC